MWLFTSQEYWSGVPFPSSRDLPDPGIKPTSPAFELIKPLILKHLQDLPSLVPVCSGQSLILTLNMWNWCQSQPLSSRCHALGIYVLWIGRAFGKEKLLVSCLGCDGKELGLQFYPSNQILALVGEGEVSSLGPIQKQHQFSLKARRLDFSGFEAFRQEETTPLAE